MEYSEIQNIAINCKWYDKYKIILMLNYWIHVKGKLLLLTKHCATQAHRRHGGQPHCILGLALDGVALGYFVMECAGTSFWKFFLSRTQAGTAF
jgi:hypothetical protein